MSEAPRVAIAYAGRSRDVVADDGYVYVAEQGGVHIVDVQNPKAPRLAGHLPLAGAAGVAVRDRMLFAVAPSNGLSTHNVSSPASISQMGRLVLPGALALSLGTRTAHVAGGGGGADSVVWAVDVGDPNAPTTLSQFATGGAASGVFVDSGVAYVADDTGGLVLLGAAGEPPPPITGAKVNYLPIVYR